MADSLRVLELPNRIRVFDEEITPLQIDQNFEEIAYAVSLMQKFINDNIFSITGESTSDFELNAITHGPGDPVDE
ncbi:MAG TPA: hypothetical protein PKO32_03245 [Syntrophomonadaceae bacterium]|nr:hypothetical protein [Syntrophomonadaceae bacterium]